jgi:cytochrome oxidase assembly protein ShyY1
MSTRRALAWAVPAALACAGFAALGFWQLDRGAWKARLLDAWAQAASDAPRDYAASVGQRERLPRREDLATPSSGAALPLRVRVRGRWDASSNVLLDNQRLDDAVGVIAYTRFVPSDGATPLMVARGWLPLPADRKPPVLPAPGAAPVEIAGLLVAAPATGMRLGTFDPGTAQAPRLNTRLDLDALRADGPLFDGVLQLDADQPDGFTRRWQALPNTLPPEKHRGYALQWFGLATAVAVIYSVLALRLRR